MRLATAEANNAAQGTATSYAPALALLGEAITSLAVTLASLQYGTHEWAFFDSELGLDMARDYLNDAANQLRDPPLTAQDAPRNGADPAAPQPQEHPQHRGR
ncbi:hypothetical protein [Streptomyces sp. GZWMJZ-114]|uniref:hypothetical protein n=1 Tax=Streptomyces sp. GZWMJZ-114 TaxID=2494734 RepID=UPI001012D718|nr:hypothetical protein [Streptomyces sp. GZWMJZ-114]